MKSAGLYKSERVITSTQSYEIELADGSKVLNFCTDNYHGLADNEDLGDAAKAALDHYGYGMASVHFICGTQEEHKQLEARVSSFLKVENTILCSSCFDANAGLFETLLGEEDAIISDALNHASIIDGIRLSKARRFRYATNDMASLEELKKAEGSRFKLIATDGVFSMDGIIANLGGVCDFAEKYDAMVMEWSTTAMRSAWSADMGAARRSIAASRAGWTSSPARWARRSEARRAATRQASSSTGFASARRPTSSPIR
ncbi:hypothetical protein MesoLj113a_72000 [Mesorhizobium sp. 113-1-2]|nr:hypothetical protein MesoLj113a_72000 [Mesorhizobium sp. 113-1-2]